MLKLYIIMLASVILVSEAYGVGEGTTREEQFAKMRAETIEWLVNQIGECKVIASRLTTGSELLDAALIGITRNPYGYAIGLIIAAYNEYDALWSRRAWYCFNEYCQKTVIGGSEFDYCAQKLWENIDAEEYISRHFTADCIKYKSPSMWSANRCNNPCPFPANLREIENIRNSPCVRFSHGW